MRHIGCFQKLDKLSPIRRRLVLRWRGSVDQAKAVTRSSSRASATGSAIRLGGASSRAPAWTPSRGPRGLSSPGSHHCRSGHSRITRPDVTSVAAPVGHGLLPRPRESCPAPALPITSLVGAPERSRDAVGNPSRRPASRTSNSSWRLRAVPFWGGRGAQRGGLGRTSTVAPTV